MTTSTMTKTTQDQMANLVTNALRGRLAIPLTEYGAMRSLEKDAVAKKAQRGHLEVETVWVGKQRMVPAPEVYRAFGLTPPDPSRPRIVLAQVELHSDGTVRLVDESLSA